MNIKNFWKGYQVCIEDCQGVIKERAKTHGNSVEFYYDCIGNEQKAALVEINKKYQRLRYKINTGGFAPELLLEDMRDLINATAFLYSLVWEKSKEEKVKRYFDSLYGLQWEEYKDRHRGRELKDE